MNNTIQFTRITSAVPQTLTKEFHLVDGQLNKRNAGHMVAGEFQKVRVFNLNQLAEELQGLKSNQAITWGCPQAESGPITTADNVPADRSVIARTREFFSYAPGPGVLMLDHDGTLNDEILDAETLIARLIEAVPELKDAPILWRPSASSGIATTDGRVLTRMSKHRLYIPVKDASKIPSAGKQLLTMLWAAGMGWYEVGKAGQALERALFDGSVWQPERLDFAAGPVLGPGLTRAHGSFKIFGDPQALFDLSLIQVDSAEAKRAAENRKHARARIKAAQVEKQEVWATERAPTLAQERNISVDQAKAILIRASQRQILTGDFMLTAQDGRRVSVGEILDRPGYWHNKKFADPFGDYPDDRRIATTNLKSGTRPVLRSFGHGGQVFELLRQSARVQIGKGRRIEATDATLFVLRDRGELFDFGEGAIAYVAEGRARSVNKDWLVDHIGRVIEYFSIKEEINSADERIQSKEQAEDAPPIIAAAILAKTGERDFKKLTAVITAPTLREDGTILDTPGYDEQSGLLYYYGGDGEPPKVELSPTPEVAIKAFKFLWEPFSRFPLVDDVSRGVLLQAIFTAALRGSLPTAPGTGFDAPTAGTGKTLLARAIGVLATGSDPAILPPADSDEEMRKRLFASLRDGARVILCDNVREPFGGGSLDAFLTASSFADRILGESMTVSLPNKAVFIVTGNNLHITGDTCRRVLVATLDAGTEKAYQRQFSFDPIQLILKNRSWYVIAVLTIVRAWIAAGRPRIAAGNTASYEKWDELVRQPICWLAGIIAATDPNHSLPRFADPLKATEKAYEQDPDTNAFATLAGVWHRTFDANPITVRTLIDKASVSTELRDVLDEIVPTQGGINARSLGKWLQRNAGRIAGDLRLERGKNARDNVALWAIKRQLDPTAKNPA